MATYVYFVLVSEKSTDTMPKISAILKLAGNLTVKYALSALDHINYLDALAITLTWQNLFEFLLL